MNILSDIHKLKDKYLFQDFDFPFSRMALNSIRKNARNQFQRNTLFNCRIFLGPMASTPTFKKRLQILKSQMTIGGQGLLKPFSFLQTHLLNDILLLHFCLLSSGSAKRDLFAKILVLNSLNILWVYP